ncbi:hypothetical protein HYALB_00004051 [Hymenoscyphus albidus]|uniref:Uncharacterized protein n=1 Tax=Hymenoscyphus albidus TaxID=595503 RepID=A0A9N9M0I2_9HELO|nr:hypothetical protein HYALB_00004051 [Hymenoscyphus albidus]
MRSLLEVLPVEIHRQILLYITDRSSVRSLIHASLPLRQAYLTECARMHRAINPKMLNSALFAQAVFEVRPDLARKELRKIIHDQRLLRSYLKDQWLVQLQIFTFNDLHNLLRTQKIIDFLTSDVRLWFEDMSNPAELLGPSFSSTERFRVQRALYLYTIWTRLFGPERIKEEEGLSRPYCHGNSRAFADWTEKTNMLFSLPHTEINEFGFVVEYIKARYAHYFSEIQEDQDHDAEGNEDLRGSISETGIEDLTPGGGYYNDFLDTMISLGPEFLYEVLQTSDHKIRRLLITEQLSLQPDSIRRSLQMMPGTLIRQRKWSRIILDSETLEDEREMTDF